MSESSSWLSRIKSWYVGLKARKSWCDTNGSHMVNINAILHKASSKIEAEAWVASVGKKRYPGVTMKIVKDGEKWLVRSQ